MRQCIQRFGNLLAVSFLTSWFSNLYTPHIAWSHSDDPAIAIASEHVCETNGCVVLKYSADDAFVLTAYLTDKPKKRTTMADTVKVRFSDAADCMKEANHDRDGACKQTKTDDWILDDAGEPARKPKPLEAELLPALN